MISSAYRVRQQRKKERETMMKKTVAVLTILILAVIASGCVRQGSQAPESELPLDVAQMIETGTGKTGADPAMTVPSKDLYTRLDAPEHYETEIVSESGFLKVHADADVVLPKGTLPMARLDQDPFTIEEVREYAKVLFDPDAKYVDLTGHREMTKGFWQLAIDEMQYAIDNWDTVGQGMYNQYDTIDEIREAMKDLQKRKDLAPDTLPAYTPTEEWIYGTGEYYNEETGKVETITPAFYDLYTTKDDAHFSQINTFGNQIQYYRDGMVHGTSSPFDEDVSGKLKITKDEAYAVALKAIDDLGLEGFACTLQAGMVSDHWQWYAWNFLFERELNGIPTTPVFHTGDSDGRELLRIVVDDAGIVSLQHRRMRLTEVLTEDAELLPFDEIRDVFETMITVVDNQTEAPAWNKPGMPKLEKEYFIQEIRLGLKPVFQYDNLGEVIRYYLLPAWDFLGYSTAKVNGMEEKTHIIVPPESFLTVNAVDGTVIKKY
jgi:hypothetical protein